MSLGWNEADLARREREQDAQDRELALYESEARADIYERLKLGEQIGKGHFAVDLGTILRDYFDDHDIEDLCENFATLFCGDKFEHLTRMSEWLDPIIAWFLASVEHRTDYVMERAAQLADQARDFRDDEREEDS